MKHLTTTLLILFSLTLFGQDGGIDQIMVKTNYLQIDSLKEIAPSQVKVLIVDENSSVGYTTNLPGGSSLWDDNGTYINYLGGNVAIGDTLLEDKNLHVYGSIYSHEVRVRLYIPAPDYVFEPNYQLMSLAELQSYLEKHKHLPEVPSAKEMEKDGVKLSEMNMLLLKKVEELTLYTLKQQREIDTLKKVLNEQKQ